VGAPTGLVEIGASQQGQTPLNMDAEGFTSLKAVTRQPVETEETEKT
jgi:hypothetical protein